MNARSRVVMFVNVAVALTGRISRAANSIAVAAPSFHLGHQFGHPLCQRLADNSVELGFQMHSNRLRNGGSLLGFTGDRLALAARRFVWHDASSLKGNEPRHSRICSKNR